MVQFHFSYDSKKFTQNEQNEKKKCNCRCIAGMQRDKSDKNIPKTTVYRNLENSSHTYRTKNENSSSLEPSHNASFMNKIAILKTSM